MNVCARSYVGYHRTQQQSRTRRSQRTQRTNAIQTLAPHTHTHKHWKRTHTSRHIACTQPRRVCELMKWLHRYNVYDTTSFRAQATERTDERTNGRAHVRTEAHNFGFGGQPICAPPIDTKPENSCNAVQPIHTPHTIHILIHTDTPAGNNRAATYQQHHRNRIKSHVLQFIPTTYSARRIAYYSLQVRAEFHTVCVFRIVVCVCAYYATQHGITYGWYIAHTRNMTKKSPVRDRARWSERLLL